MNFSTSRSPVTWLVLLSLLNHVGFNGTRFVAVLAILSLTGSSFMAGALLATLSLVPALTSLPLGRWIDRHHKAWPMRLGGAMVAFGCALPVLFQDVVALFLSAGLVGAGFNMHQIALQSTMGRAGGDATERTRLFSLLSLCVSVSMVGAPLVAGFGIEHGGYRVAQAILTLGPLATLVLLYRRRAQLAREPALAGSLTLSAAAAAASPWARMRLSFGPTLARLGAVLRGRRASTAQRRPSSFAMLRDPPMARLMVASVAVSASFDLHTFAVPLLGHALELAPSQIGTVISCFAVGSFLVRLAMPWLARTVRGWTIVHGAMVICAAGYYVYPWAPGPVAMGALSCLIGMALGSCQPNLLAQLHEIVPHERSSEAIALRVMFSYASGFLLPFVFGAVAARLGVAPLFFAIATVLAAARWISRRRHDEGGRAAG